MTVSPATLAQTIALLALSRGEQPKIMPPIARQELLRKRWITPSHREPGSTDKRHHDITADGSAALAVSPFLAQAQRAIDNARTPQVPATGYVSDSIKRSVRR